MLNQRSARRDPFPATLRRRVNAVHFTPSPRSRAAAALLSLSLLAGSCSPESAGKVEVAAPPPPPSFVVVLVDTLRADRLDAPGRAADLSPRFDALRAAGTYFSSAYSTSAWTLPATVSLFLSQAPSQHDVTRWGSLLGPEHLTLTEVLQHAGYRTGGWSANRLVTAERGFEQGFDSFEFVSHPKWKPKTPPHSPYVFAAAEDVVSKAVAWLDQEPAATAAAPFFLYLHLMDPHTPYLCPPSAGESCKKAAGALNRRLTTVQWAFDDVERRRIENLYESDVRRADAALGLLYDALGERGLLANTWLILTSDHGEMLGEHGLWVHGHALYEETLRVPLLIHSESAPSGRGARVKAPVSLVDVAPTLLDLAGIRPPAPFKGRSLRPALEGRPLPERPLVAELLPVRDEPDKHQRHLLSVTRGRTKLVLGIDGMLERFDLSSDPNETTPLPAETDVLEALLAEVGIPFDHVEAASESTPELSQEMLEHLKGLGYIHE